MRIHCLAMFVCIFSFAPGSFAQRIAIVSDEWPQMEVLAKYFEEKGCEVDSFEQDALPSPLAGYDAAVQFIHGAMSDKTAETLIDFTEAGGRTIVLHHGISSKKKETKGWLPFMGIHLDRAENAADRYVWIHGVDLVFVNLQPDHYITSNGIEYNETVQYRSSDQPSPAQTLPAITFEDTEVFLNHQFNDGREKTVLFGFVYQDGKSGETVMQDRSGWMKPRGDGWLFYFQPGHTVADFEEPRYARILLNCLTWQP